MIVIQSDAVSANQEHVDGATIWTETRWALLENSGGTAEKHAVGPEGVGDGVGEGAEVDEDEDPPHPIKKDVTATKAARRSLISNAPSKDVVGRRPTGPASVRAIRSLKEFAASKAADPWCHSAMVFLPA